MFLTIIIFILVLSVLVFAHEFGHFITARRFKIKTDEFGLGFPPRAIGWYRNRLGKWRRISGNIDREKLEAGSDAVAPGEKNTIYSLNWLPLGGFVKIKGENGEDRGETNSFASKKIWQRVIVLSAGVIMNIILAWLLFSAGYIIGMPQSTDALDAGARVTQAHVIVAQVMPNSPAAQAGLVAGDIISQLDQTPITSESGLQAAVSSHNGQEVSLTVERNNQDIVLKAVPKSDQGAPATIGVAIFSSGLVSYNFWASFWEGAKTDVWILGQIFVSLGNIIVQIFQGQQVSGQFAGPVGIATITGQAARLGFSYLLQFMAILSLNLAVVNILPLPALDGGRVLFLVIEKLKGKPVRRELENVIHNTGFILLLLLVLFITYKDIMRLF